MKMTDLKMRRPHEATRGEAELNESELRSHQKATSCLIPTGTNWDTGKLLGRETLVQERDWMSLEQS
ncbi:hypothetical protein AGIG_G206 [Arapaima gigas]